MFDRPRTGERAVLVQLSAQLDQEVSSELTELARSAGAIPMATVAGSRRRPDPRYFIGKGKLAELQSTVSRVGAELVLFNHALTPSQERNLERALDVRVVDRNSLILDIFAQRAQSFEGKLQVELAQLRHLSTRLIRGWSHLERQKGGIGLRGPGETQLETDRRLIGVRIRHIQRRLGKVVNQREQGRSARRKAGIPTVSLVGYTNAGKSTLFNALTESDVYVADQLFATLDPTLRRCTLPKGGQLIVSDTVGFVRDLPHELVAAFRSTLREAVEADVLLHVIDVCDDDKTDTIKQVDRVLADIGADHIRRIEVYNKIDRMEGMRPGVDRQEDGSVRRVRLSAATGEGVSLLTDVLSAFVRTGRVRKRFHLSPCQARLRSRLFDLATVMRDEAAATGGWDMEVEIQKKDLGLLKSVGTVGGSF